MATVLDLVGTDAKKLDDGVTENTSRNENVNDKQSIFYKTGRFLSAPKGEMGLQTVATELGKDFAKGAVEMNTELLKLVPKALTYTPYLGLVKDAPINIGASLIAGVSKDKELDDAFSFSTSFANRKEQVKDLEEYFNIKQIDETLDEVSQDFQNKLKKDYELGDFTLPFSDVKISYHNVGNLTGQFVSPGLAVKPFTFLYRGVKGLVTSGLLKNSQRKLINEVKGKTDKIVIDKVAKPISQATDQELKNLTKSPLERYKLLGPQGVNNLSASAKREIKRLEKYEKELNIIERKNALGLRNEFAYEGSAALGAAISVAYIESRMPENSYWLAPLAGVLAAFTVPPVVVGNGRSIIYNFLAYGNMLLRSKYVDPLRVSRLSDVILGREKDEVILDHFIRARGINPKQLKDSSGNIPTDPKERVKLKQQFVGTDEKQLKFYERIATAIQQQKPELQQPIYQSIENLQRIYEKIRSRASRKGMEEAADGFAPLIYNVLNLQGIRSLNASLLGNLDAGFFLQPNKTFKRNINNTLSNLEDQQKINIKIIEQELNDLRVMGAGEKEIDVLIGEFRDMLGDAQRSVAGQSGKVTASGQDLSTILKGKTVGLEDLQLQNDAIQMKRRLIKEERIGDADAKVEFDRENSRLIKNIFANSKRKVNEAYENAFTDPVTGKDIMLNSTTAENLIVDLINRKAAQTQSFSEGISAGRLKYFLRELRQNTISELPDSSIETLGRKINLINDTAKKNSVNAVEFDENYKVDFFNQAFDKILKDPTDTKAKKNLGSWIEKFIFDETSDKSIRDLIKGTDAEDILNSITNKYLGPSLSLKEIHRLRMKFFNDMFNSSSSLKQQEAGDMVDILTSFFDELSTQGLDAKLDRLLEAQSTFKKYAMPLRKPALLKQKKLQTQQEHFSVDNFNKLNRSEAEKLANSVAEGGTLGDETFISLINPSIQQGSKFLEQGGNQETINSLRSMYSLLNDADKVQFKKSIRRAFASALSEEDKVLGFAFHNKMNLGLLKGLKENDLISTEDFNEFRKIPDFHKKTQVFQEQQNVFSRLQGDLASLESERGGVLGSSLLQGVIRSAESVSDPLKRNEAIADALTVLDREDMGLRYFAGKIDVDDARIKSIEEFLEPDEIERFGQNLRGETSAFTIKRSGVERVIDYPEEVKTPIAKLLYELDTEIKLGGKLGKRSQSVKDSLNDIFVTALSSKAFKMTDEGSAIETIGKTIKELNGVKQVSGFYDNLDAKALQASYNNYRPYFEALHKNPVKLKNASTGAEETVNILEELDDLVTVAISVSQPIAGVRPMTGIPGPMRFESALSRLWGIARGVVSTRFVLSEFAARRFREGQSEVLKKFLTDPTAIHSIHNVFVKGRTQTPFVKQLFQEIFNTRTLAIVVNQNATEDTDGQVEQFFDRFGEYPDNPNRDEAMGGMSEGEAAIIEYLKQRKGQVN